MTHYFLDSSALVKRYVVEAGTPWVRLITSQRTNNVIFIAHITPVEIVSGTMRRKREGSISTRTAHAVRLLVDRHASREYKVIGLTDLVVQRAEDLLENHML